MPPLNGHSVPQTDTYYLHMHPVTHSLQELPLGSEWSSDDPGAITYVSVGRASFSARIQEVTERLTAHGISVTGPLVPDDSHAAKTSRHDTWVLRVPHGKEADAGYATSSIGAIVGPIRTEVTAAMNEDPVTSDTLPKPRMRSSVIAKAS